MRRQVGWKENRKERKVRQVQPAGKGRILLHTHNNIVIFSNIVVNISVVVAIIPFVAAHVVVVIVVVAFEKSGKSEFQG